MTDQLAVAYEGTEPFPDADGGSPARTFEGEVIGWVAIHRRHHAFTDRPGDPHSPYRYDPWQIDISAAVIRIFERLGWATGVHWPGPARLDSRRRGRGKPEPAIR